MSTEALDEATCALEMLEIAAMAHETGRQDILDALRWCEYSYDSGYEFAMEGLSEVGDLMSEHCPDNSDIHSMYFSSHTMMEYYRLCREYGKLKEVSLQDNPYMRQAASEMRQLMHENGCYTCDYHLQTKVNHKWASGIVFHYDCSCFTEFLALLSRLFYVFQFYDETVKELRAEVEKLRKQRGKVLTLPTTANRKRRAA